MRVPIKQASCGTCLHPQRLMYGSRIAPHDVEVAGEGMQPCPGSGEPPVMAADLREDDVLWRGGPLPIRNVLPFDGGDDRLVDVEVGRDWLTLPADEPVIITTRALAVA